LTAAPDDDESELPSTPEEFGDEELDDDDLDAEPRDR
jgi:hypothetical protein